MKPVLATAFGCLLAAGLAYATPKSTPEDLVNRYFAANDVAGISASYGDWHPTARHQITVKYGLGQPDDVFSYAVSGALNEDMNDPRLAEMMAGYEELSRKPAEITISTVDAAQIARAVTTVRYHWQGMEGDMVQTDTFRILPHFGRPAIHALDTVLDYR